MAGDSKFLPLFVFFLLVFSSLTFEDQKDNLLAVILLAGAAVFLLLNRLIDVWRDKK